MRWPAAHLILLVVALAGLRPEGLSLCPASLGAEGEYSWWSIADRGDTFETGGLGQLMDEKHKVWACFYHHCSPLDPPCWKYNEVESSWNLWGLNSELQLIDYSPPLDEHSDGSALKYINGTIGTIWMMPSGLRSSKCCSVEDASDLGNNSWWRHPDDWAGYLERRESDAKRMRRILGDGERVSSIIYFPAYLADPVFGHHHTQRLNQVVEDFYQQGITPVLLIGRPDYKVNPTDQYATQAHNPVHDDGALNYLKGRIWDIVSLPSVEARVRHVSVYWVGLSWFCQSQSGSYGCSEDEILEFNTEMQRMIETHPGSMLGYKHLLHLDGPFWEGCWPQPCEVWNYSGYTPRSISGMSGILAESWVQGSLPGGVRKLLDEGVTDVRSLLLISDVPNCDLYPDKPCAVQTRNPAADLAQWFAWLRNNGLGSTWATWNYVDGGIGEKNYYGDAWQNSTDDVTTKGELYRKYALGIL